jgi:predicted GNAT family N-acyltransferase
MVEISAQTHAQGFYEHYGFEAEGDIYMEEGIPHVKMTVTPDKMRLESKCSRCGKCGKEAK